MKQVIVNVEEKKYEFFMELLKNLDFVSVQNEDKAKTQVLKHIAEGMQGALLASKGKIKARPAKSFLNEL